MRDDMATVVTERPRHGHKNKSKKTTGSLIRHYDPDAVGRPWNKVHSELSQKLDRRSVTGSHIWDHVMWEIETDCHIGPDRLAYRNRPRFRHRHGPVDGLYVHPRTGLIREQRIRRDS